MYLVARKNKPSNEKGIFMINATKEFEASKRQNI
ncbi:SAM-dependent methyltransferase [Mesomycoplasma neurolyticum]|nr:SAM-dependent methyltransferase [Mesomycoplasma neurolyticum]